MNEYFLKCLQFHTYRIVLFCLSYVEHSDCAGHYAYNVKLIFFSFLLLPSNFNAIVGKSQPFYCVPKVFLVLSLCLSLSLNFCSFRIVYHISILPCLLLEAIKLTLNLK